MGKVFVVIVLCLLSGCASFKEHYNHYYAQFTGKIDPNSRAGKAQAEKEAYFRDPGKDVLIVIEALTYRGELAPQVDYLDVDLSFSTLRDSWTRKVYTPIVMRIPMSEWAKGMSVDYDSLSAVDKAKFDVQSAMEFTISVMAQSNSEAFGLEGKIYYAGKEQVSDSNATSFGAVHLTYTLPVAELTRK